VLLELARAMPHRGVTLGVIGLMRPDSSPYPGLLVGAGATVTSADLRTRWDPRGLWRAVVLARDFQPALLHTHGKHADLVGAWVARRLRVPQVSTLHLIEDRPSLVGRRKRWLAVLVRSRLTDRTLAVSDAVRDWYVGTLGAPAERVVTLHNGTRRQPLDLERRAQVRADLQIPPGAFVVTMAAIMRPGKGHRDLLEALALIPAGLQVVVLLAGDGPLRADLEVKASRLGVAERVRFLGFREDVPALLGASDLIAHPSHFDALPTALIEGLAAGIPQVATAVGGIPEIVTPGTGVLVRPGQPRQLAEAISQLARDPARRQAMSVAASRRFEQEFDIEVCAERLRAVYDALVAPKLVTRPPWHFRLAAYLNRHGHRGGYRILAVAKRKGKLTKVVRYRLSREVAFDVPIFRSENQWTRKDVLRYDPPLIDDLEAAVREATAPITFIDGGADIGVISALLVARCPNLRRVIAFEPNETAYIFLRRNLEHLAVPSQSWHAALADFNGTGELQSPSYDNSDHGRFIVPDETGGIPVMRVDDLNIDPGESLILKLDVEGAELDALRGAAATLRQASEFVVSFEAHPLVVERTGVEPVEVVKFVRSIKPCRVTVSDIRGFEMRTDRPFFSQISKPLAMGYNVLCRSTDN
jgi:FkbM family methyltransferase